VHPETSGNAALSLGVGTSDVLGGIADVLRIS
jgi:hypothetical protein